MIMAKARNLSIKYSETLTHRVLSTCSWSSAFEYDGLSVDLVINIDNFVVNIVKLPDGKIVKFGSHERIDSSQQIDFGIAVSFDQDEAKRSCKFRLWDFLTSHNVERITIEYFAPLILSYLLKLAKSNHPSGPSHVNCTFELRASLIVTKEEIADEKTLLGGIKKEIFNGEEMRCAICLEMLCGGCECAVTPCSHVFHRDCILPWMVRKNRCPMCRRILRKS